MSSIVPHEQLKGVLDFFSPDKISEAIDRCGFTVRDEMQILTDIARSGEGPMVQMAALKMLNARFKEGLILAGMMRTETAEGKMRDSQGREITVQSKTTRLLSEASSETSGYLDVQVVPPQEQEKEDDPDPSEEAGTSSDGAGSTGFDDREDQREDSEEAEPEPECLKCLPGPDPATRGAVPAEGGTEGGETEDGVYADSEGESAQEEGVFIDDEGEQHSGLGEVREGHFPPIGKRPGLAAFHTRVTSEKAPG